MSIFDERKQYSEIRLKEFKQRVESIHELNELANFCIYTTGSYGRFEASEQSDIDLFFLNSDSKKVSKLKKTLIDAQIINICKNMRLPEFSGDGEYLQIHSVSEMMEELGSPNDDFKNYFTARMLLLLESSPIYNSEIYEKLVNKIIEKYYKDFHEHEKDFEPIFLVNDIIRFWKTMCLNYEHKRNRKFLKSELSDIEIELKKKETFVKNLKLKFSRKLTCYSFLIKLIWSEGVITHNQLFKITQETPIERLKSLCIYPEIKADVEQALVLYQWFREKTQTNIDDVLLWIGDKQNRDEAFGKSRIFAKCLYEIMIKTRSKEKLMYFLV
jgi:predicted nucleotidyltransferase